MVKINESAVSPVVGVMLMLVVTIVIAAIVSAFAGGLGNTDVIVPKATIQGMYSQSTGVFQLYHAGGDELSTQNLIIMIGQNDEDFGGYGSMFKGVHNIANKSRIYNTLSGERESWNDYSTGQYTIPVFRPGETMYYDDEDSKLSKLDVEDVGKSLILEIDSIDGQLISKSKVMIDP